MTWPYHVKVTGHDGAVLFEDSYRDWDFAEWSARQRSEYPEAAQAEVTITFRNGAAVDHGRSLTDP